MATQSDGYSSVHAEIRESIVQGDLAPGQRLVEPELSTRFNAPRGAIRLALVQLEVEGLVERERNRGARVRPIGLEEAIQITEARAVLEGLCAARAAELANDQQRDRLRELCDRMTEGVEGGDVVTYSECAGDIHRVIREASKHEHAAAILRRLRYQSLRYHLSIALLPGRMKVGLEEHREVVNAVIGGNPKIAEAEMRKHLDSVVASLRELAGHPEMRLFQKVVTNPDAGV